MTNLNLEQWFRFVNCASREWDECEFKDQLLKLVGNDLGIAKVIFMLYRSHSLEFVNERVEAYGWKAPEEFINNNETDKLKALLLMTPM